MSDGEREQLADHVLHLTRNSMDNPWATTEPWQPEPKDPDPVRPDDDWGAQWGATPSTETSADHWEQQTPPSVRLSCYRALQLIP